MKTLAELLIYGGKNHPALIIPRGPRVTYQELGNQVEVLASALKAAGLEPGQMASIVLGNNLQYVTAFLAVTRVGAIASPLNPGYTSEEYRFYMENASAVLAILPAEDHPARKTAQELGIPCINATVSAQGMVELSQNGVTLEPQGEVEPPQPDQIALYLHTSGTTGQPKGVPLTHANLTTSLENIINTYTLTPQDVAMVVMPLFHVHGLLGALFSTLASGGTAVLPSRFSASTFWAVVAEHHANWYTAVPTIHQILLNRADNDKAPRGVFRFIRSCSAALTPAVMATLESRFDAPVLEAYGMTEASHQMSSNHLPPGERKAGTVGQGTGVQIAIIDEAGNLLAPGERGEVAIQGPNVTKGYHNNPEAKASSFTNGWFRTGDQGHMDTSGYLTLTGRLTEVINRGGEKISPPEVDAVIAQHPAVAEAISFGVPDAKYGEEIHAAVVLKEEATKEEIQTFCLKHLISFKVPKVIYFVDKLPHTATGKIQRKSLATTFLQSSQSPSPSHTS